MQTNEEKQFEKQLGVFRREVELAICYFYTEMTIHDVGSNHKKVLKKLNKNPLFWNTVIRSMQESTYISLGRIFNESSEKYSLHLLKRYSEKYRILFTKKSFKIRFLSRMEGYDNTRINSYLEDVLEPTHDIMRKLAQEIKKLTKIYKEKFDPLRDNFFAHRNWHSQSEIEQNVPSKTIRGVESFLMKLHAIGEFYWQLYYNGRINKLPLEPKRYSTRRLRTVKYKKYHSKPINAHIIEQVENALKII